MLNSVTELLQSCATYIYSALINAINSVTGFVFGSEDDDSTDSDNEFGFDNSSYFDDEDLFPTEHTRLINPKRKYNFYSAIDEDTKGNNNTTEIFYSYSKVTSAKKLWVSKQEVDKIGCRYTINSITTEIFAAWLYVYLFGKDNAPKAKFNPDFHGILSRIVGDKENDTQDLYEAFLNFVPYIAIPSEAHDSFLKAIIFMIIIANRDITYENFVFKTADNRAPIIYPIDCEFSLAPPLQRPTEPLLATTSTIRPNHMSLKELLIALDNDPRNIARITLDGNFNWNNVFMQHSNEHTIAEINQKFFDFFTRDTFRRTLREIVDNIESDDFAICRRAKDKMLQQLAAAPDTYSPALIAETIIPRIDAATTALRENVACINEFLAQMALEATTPSRAANSTPQFLVS